MNFISRTIALFGAATVTTLSFGQAEVEFAELISKTQERIESSLQEYQALLTETQSEKLELVSKINKLENTLVKLRRDEAAASRSAKESELELEELRILNQTLDTQSQYSQGVLSEYLTNFESRIHVSEDQNYQQPLLEARESLAGIGDNPADRLPILFKALDIGLERQKSLVGGTRFPGKAITSNGGVKSGTLALIGPVAFFASDDGTAIGPIKFNSGTIEPGISKISPEDATALKSIVEKGSGLLPLDSSLGNALILNKAKGTILEHVAKGGWVGYAILILGAASIFVALYKIIDLRGTRVQEPEDIRSIAEAAAQGKTENATSQLKPISGPIAKMLTIGIEFSTTTQDTLLDAMESIILRNRPRLERFLPMLATTAAVAPLMGLLGTVVGMIKTFTLIEVFGTGDAKSLSSGISEALVTTELGLIVAIPALIFHGVFTRIMRNRTSAMEEIAADFSRHVFATREKGK